MKHLCNIDSNLFHGDDPEKIKSWIEAGNDIFGFSEFGESLLHIAVSLNAVRILKFLLELGLDPNAPDNIYGCSPITWAQRAEPVIFLNRHGASLTLENKQGLSPLHLAARHGQIELILTLIALGVDMYASCSASKDPAVFEAFVLPEYTVSVLATFAAAGFDMKGKDGEWTLLHKAVNERHHEARDFLLDLGADPSFKDDEGCDVAAIE